MRKTHAMREVRKHFLFKGKTMKESSRELSPKIARQRDRVHERAQNGVALSVKSLRPKRVLDVGTGYGMNVKFLAVRFAKSARVWSVDTSPAVIHEMKKIMRGHQYSQVIFKQANAEQLPFKSGHFELVVSLFLIHHLSNPKRGLLEMGRVLFPGGKLIIADWRPAKSRVVPHAQKDIPPASLVIKHLRQLGYSIRNRGGRYWYLIEATK